MCLLYKLAKKVIDDHYRSEIRQPNEVMHLSAIVYNLKKYLKFEQKPVKSGAEILALAALVKRIFQLLFGAYIKYRKLAYNF